MNDLDNGKRSEFLIQWYRTLWENINRSMEGIWKILAPITVVGSIFVAIHKDFLPPALGMTFAFIILFWALNVSIDLNKWHRRNLFFLTKVENEFLDGKDYGKIIPKNYYTPKKDWIKFFKINVYVFCSILILCIIYSLTLIDKIGLPYHWLVLIIGSSLTFLNYRNQEKSTEKHFKELFSNGSEQISTKTTNK